MMASISSLNSQKKPEIIENFCTTNNFKKPDLSLDRQRITFESIADPQIRIDVTPQSVATPILPADNNQKMKLVDSIVELYMKAIQDKPGSNHVIQCKNPDLQTIVEGKLAQALLNSSREKKEESRINGKPLGQVQQETANAEQDVIIEMSRNSHRINGS